MNPEDRLRALNDSDRWTVNAIQPRENPFGYIAPARRRQSWRMIFAEIGVVVAVGAIIFGVIAVQNGSEDNLSNPIPLPDVTSSTPTPTPSPTVTPPVETPTPPPVPPAAPVAEKVVLTTRALEFQTSAGDVVETLPFSADDWERQASETTAALTEIFDEDPTVTEKYARTKWGKYFTYEWDGFVAQVRGDVYGGDWVFQVDVTASRVNGIAIETRDGFTVGTPVFEVGELVNDEYGQEPFAPGEDGYYLVERVELTGAQAEAEKELMGDDFVPVDGVAIDWEDGETTVTRIGAPAQNYGD